MLNGYNTIRFSTEVLIHNEAYWEGSINLTLYMVSSFWKNHFTAGTVFTKTEVLSALTLLSCA